MIDSNKATQQQADSTPDALPATPAAMPATITSTAPVAPSTTSATTPNQASTSYPQSLAQVVWQQVQAGEIGVVELTDEQKQILFSDFSDDDVLIRPDGLVYLSWTWYAERLSRAFGLSWQLIPEGEPKIMQHRGNPLLIWGFRLFIHGRYMGMAYGEHIEQRSNTMSYGDMCESAKSNALMRLCKGIGMSLKLWQREYVDNWIANYAIQETKQGRAIWRKLTKEEIETKRNNFRKALHALKIDEATYRSKLLALGYDSSRSVPVSKMTDVYLAMRDLKEKIKNQEKKGE